MSEDLGGEYCGDLILVELTPLPIAWVSILRLLPIYVSSAIDAFSYLTHVNKYITLNLTVVDFR